MRKHLIEIWAEGFRATGDYGNATKLGEIAGAKGFKEACQELMRLRPDLARYYDAERNTYWGCRLFDNEKDARKQFG